MRFYRARPPGRIARLTFLKSPPPRTDEQGIMMMPHVPMSNAERQRQFRAARSASAPRLGVPFLPKFSSPPAPPMMPPPAAPQRAGPQPPGTPPTAA